MQHTAATRHVKGPNLIGLVKLLKQYRKTQPLTGISRAALALMDEHILLSNWYDFAPFMELVEFTWREILGCKEENALAMGITGGTAALEAFHRVFISPGDPVASLLAMRHAWRAYFDFGELSEDVEGRSVRFSLDGYPDVTAAHALLIAGWHVAAARVSGSAKANVELIERPWKGGARLVHRVYF